MAGKYQLSLRQLLGLTAACGVVFAFVPYVVTGYNDLHTCALCRTNRTEYVYEGFNWRTVFMESACTHWYRDNVEPEHEHVWVHARATAMRNLYGQPFGVMDRDPGGKLIWALSSDDQLAVYQHLQDPLEGKALFLSFTDPNPQVQNDDWRVLHSLKGRKDSGFEGKWQDYSPW